MTHYLWIGLYFIRNDVGGLTDRDLLCSESSSISKGKAEDKSVTSQEVTNSHSNSSLFLVNLTKSRGEGRRENYIKGAGDVRPH